MNDMTQQSTYPSQQTPLPEPAPLPALPEEIHQQQAHQQQAQSQSTGQQASAPYNTPNPQKWQSRGDGLTLVAGYHFVVAALFLLGTIVMMIPTGILGIVSVVEDPDAMIAMFIVGFIAIITLVLCLLYLAVGYGLWTLKSWARVAALALAVVSLFGVPIGTITGGLTLWYLMQPEVAAKFEPS